MNHDITITVDRDDEYPDEPEIGWGRASLDCKGGDGLWRECWQDGCKGVVWDYLSVTERAAAEEDQLLRHGHKHGFRDGWLADLEIEECLLSVDGVGQGISDALYGLDRKQHLVSGDRYAVEADWEGDDDWAVTLTRVEETSPPSTNTQEASDG